MDGQSSVVKRERLANWQCAHYPRGGAPGIFGSLRLAENLLGNVRGNGNAESLSLVGLDHQKNPQDEGDEVKEAPQREAE